MTDLRGHNLEQFAQQSSADMARWLEAALLRFASSGDDMTSFSPLDTAFGTADTTASGLARVLTPLEPAPLVRFREALSQLTAIWPADLKSGWLVLVELCWRLEAGTAMETLAARASEAFLDALFGADDAKHFAIILECCRETIPFDRPAASAFLHRLAEHRLFDDSEARLTLASLCERDPKNWPLHMAVLRGALHAQARRIEKNRGLERQIEFYHDLARHIISCIGIDRLIDGLKDLYFTREYLPLEPADNWFIDQIPVLFYVNRSDDRLLVAPKRHRSNYRYIKNVEISATVTGYPEGTLDDPNFALGIVAAQRVEFQF